jgi:hypothetical protein
LLNTEGANATMNKNCPAVIRHLAKPHIKANRLHKPCQDQTKNVTVHSSDMNFILRVSR